MMKRKMQLIFPPGWTPLAPYLALPQLKGYLEAKNLNVDILDDNIRFFNYILSNEFLVDKYKKLLKRFDYLDSKKMLDETENNEYLRLLKIKILEDELYNIDSYKENIKSKNNSRESLEQILTVFSAALEVLNLYYDQDISFTNIKLNKYNERNSSDVIESIKDNKYNIFVDYYEHQIGLLNKIEEYSYIGFSITSESQLIPALTLAKKIKESYSDKIIFFGGNYITRCIKYQKDNFMFIFDFIDFISCYEGEYTLEKILEKNLNPEKFRENISSIYNIAYKREDEIILTQKKEYDINDSYCPNFDGFDLDLYFSPNIILPLFTSRNCYSNCAFCSISNGSSGDKYKIRNINEVYNQMIALQRKYNTNYFTFVDETFPFKRMLDLAKIIVNDNKHKFYWYTETRFDYKINSAEAKLLYESGCRKLQFGLESYNQRVLDKMKKNVNVNYIEPILFECISNKIAFHLFYIVGFPTESKKEINNTIDFVDYILKEAYEKYELSECTRGYSIFGLEKGSHVYNNPDLYSIELLEDQHNNIGLTCDYISKIGASEKEINKIIEKSIQKTSLLIDYSIGKLWMEELDLFLCCNNNNYVNRKNNDVKKLDISFNPFTNEKGKYSIFYIFTNGINIIMNKNINELSNLQKSILKAYGLLENTNYFFNHDYVINPYMEFNNSKNSGYVNCYDTITGDIVELSSYYYESINIIDSLDYESAYKFFIENEIYDDLELSKLFNDALKNKIIININ